MRGVIESYRQVSSRAQGSRPLKRLLLAAGIAAVALYGIGDLVSGLLYEGYRFADQAISELSAFGSPVRPIMMSVIVVHGALVTAFGVGVWLSAHRRSLRWAGIFMIGAGLIGFPTHTVFAMSSRGMEIGFNDTMHIALSMTFSILVVAAIVATAIAYRGWFRLFAITTGVVLIVFGAASGVAIQGIEQDQTAWAGAFERINAYAYFLWIVVLAVIIRKTLVVTSRRSEPSSATPAPASLVVPTPEPRL
jgi:uncharacterized membrane protein